MTSIRNRIFHYLRRLLTRLTLWSWHAVAAVVIVIAILVVLGRQMAPMLEHQRQWLEDNLSQTAGDRVTIRRLRAQWEGLTPELLINDLHVGNAARIEYVLLRLDLMATLRGRAPVFDSLSLEHATFDIPVTVTAGSASLDLNAYLRFLFGSADLHLRDIHLNLFDNQSNVLQVRFDDVVIQNTGAHHAGQGTVVIAEQDQPVRMSFDFNGDAEKFLQGEGRAYLNFGNARNVVKLQEFVWPLLPLVRPEIIWGKNGGLSGESWISWKEGAADAVSHLDLVDMRFSRSLLSASPAINIANARKPGAKASMHRVQLDYHGNIFGHVSSEGGSIFSQNDNYHASLNFPAGNLTLNQKTYATPAWQISYLGDAGEIFSHLPGITLEVPQLDLASLSKYFDLLPGFRLSNIIQGMKPRGQLENVAITFPLANEVDWQPALVRANLHDVGVTAWQGLPGLQKINGYLEANREEGFIELESHQGFSMFYPQLYKTPMEYDSALGRVYWKFPDQSSALQVGAEKIDLQGQDGEASAAFRLDIPEINSKREIEFYLSVGLKNAKVEYRNKYLPYVLPASLLQWLNQAIRGGEAYENGFVYRGTFSASPTEHVIQYYLKLRDGDIRFDPAWPALQQVSSTLFVDGAETTAAIQHATLHGLDLNNAHLAIQPAASQLGEYLTVSADVAGSAADALTLLVETPLEQNLGGAFNAWRINGDLAGKLKLGMPLDSKAGEAYQDITLNFPGNDVWLGNLELPLQQLRGEAHFSSRDGIRAEKLQAQLWGRELQMALTPVVAGNHFPDLSIDLKAAVDPLALAGWAKLPWLGFINGDLIGTGNVLLSLAHQADKPLAVLTMDTDMPGAAIELPPPLGKPAKGKLPVHLAASIWSDKQQYRIEASGLARARLDVANAKNATMTTGDVFINMKDPLPEHVTQGLHIQAQLEEATLADWLKAFDRYQQFTTSLLPPNATQQPLSTFPHADIFCKHCRVGSFAVNDVKLQIQHVAAASGNQALPAHWEVAFNQADLAGRYRYFDRDSVSVVPRMPEIDVDRVFIASNEDESQNNKTPVDEMLRPDPWIEIIPQDLPAFKVHVKQAQVGNTNLGEWNFETAPDQDGVVLKNLTATMGNLRILGNDAASGATVVWHQHNHVMETAATGSLLLSDKKESDKDKQAAKVAQPATGIQSMIESEKTILRGRIEWSGSPAMISMRRLNGDVTLHSENGRFLNSTASTDFMRVINVFNFSTWARRLKLDFTDLYKKGISYDKVDGHVHLQQGVVDFDKPLVMDSPSGKFTLQGKVDSVNNAIDASLIVTLPVNANAAWIAALAVNLPAAVGVYIISKIFKSEIDNVSSVAYKISGSLDEPDVKFDHFMGKVPIVDSQPEKNKKE